MTKLIGILLIAVMLQSCASNGDASSFGDDALVCVRAEGASLFSFFSGYVETRVVHIPTALQTAMGIDGIQEFTEKCWIDGDSLQMIEALRAISAEDPSIPPP